MIYRGAKSDDGEKAWSSIDHSKLSYGYFAYKVREWETFFILKKRTGNQLLKLITH
jgi:hypothetical protein